MRPVATLGVYGATLALVLGVGFGIGQVVGPWDPPADTAHGGAHGASGVAGESSPAAASLGLSASTGGYSLALDAGSGVGGDPLSFRVLGPGGEPLTSYEESHERDLHLVVVSRDTSSYQHLHPSLDSDGTWSVPLDLAEPGAYRVLADFVPGDASEPVVLGSDLLVPGTATVLELPAPERTVVVDGYEVALEGDLAPGKPSTLTFSVTRGGAPVDLEPYLGADGHLVALRSDDLAYLHTHPEEGGPDASEVSFVVDVPSSGTYRLFLDFQSDGVVRTAPFTLPTSAGAPGPAGTDHSGADHAH